MNKKIILYGGLVCLALLAVFQFYLGRMYPAYNNDDSPETIASACTLGIAHPPGYPLVTMLGKISSLALPGSPAFRVNILSSIIALLVLLSLFFTVILVMGGDSKSPAYMTGITAIIALGFSGAFFGQAIEAKGAVYTLNLLFLSLIIMLCLKLLKGFSLKLAALLSYIYGLSMANHWQSMLFLLPVVLSVYIISPALTGKKHPLSTACFFLLGLTPYLLLLLRASGNPALNHGDPSTAAGLLRHVLRLNYSGEFRPFSLGILAFQLGEFTRVLYPGFFLLIFFAFPGLLQLKNENKGAFLLLAASFIAASLGTIIFFRRAQESSCYYLPSTYFAAIFIAFSAAWIMGYTGQKTRKALLFTFAALAIVMAFKNSMTHDMSGNFLSYDYCNNILLTPDKDAVYFTFSDLDSMPLYYQQYEQKRRPDLKIVRSSFLAFPWGMKQFHDEFPGLDVIMVPDKPGLNMKNAIAGLLAVSPVYGGYPFAVTEKIGIPHIQTGIILKARTGTSMPLKDYFSEYSYRGIYDKTYLSDADNYAMVSNYAGAINNYGSAFLKAGDPGRAVKYYKLSLLFPYNGSRCGFYTNLARAYEKNNEKEKSADCMRLADEECGKEKAR